MQEVIDGYWRTALKTKNRIEAEQKIEEYEEGGKEVRVDFSSGYYYIFLKIPGPLARSGVYSERSF